MSRIIIHHGKKYNIFSTVVDAPMFCEGATLSELKAWYQAEYGTDGLADLETRLVRVHAKGTSSVRHQSLESEISVFLEREHLTLEQFIEKYL